MVRLRYYTSEGRIATRNRPQVPRVGDCIRLDEAEYKVTQVTWIEDQPDEDWYVNVQLERK